VSEAWVINASHLILFARIGRLDLFERLAPKIIVPSGDVKVLDRLVTPVAREIRLLEQALRATNARRTVDAYDQDDAVLGELT
jgi:predicted nucleic acid-binding protein